MKKILFGTIALLLSVSAQAQSDIKVSPCSKNPALLYVEITGESAMQIYSYTANRLHLPLSELGGVETNSMNCRPRSLSSNGDVTAVICSYVMKGKTNVPFPQVDPGFSHEAVLVCE